MFGNLHQYTNKNQFYFALNDSLAEVCNAPSDKSGVYIVSVISKDSENIIYIGSSGKIQQNGSLKTRKAGLGGLKDRIINGKQFGKIPRRISWNTQMKKQAIEKLVIRWWVTFDDKNRHIPAYVEAVLIQEYFDINGMLPVWNNEF